MSSMRRRQARNASSRWAALAAQTIAAFVLRAYKVATVPTLMYAVALWGVGLGGGYLLWRVYRGSGARA